MEETHLVQCPYCGNKIPVVLRGANTRGVSLDSPRAKHS